MTGYRVVIMCIAGFLLSCTSPEHEQPRDAEELARLYCSSCHAHTEPDMLDRSSWEAVLADMGGRMGMYTGISRDELIARNEWHDVDPAGIYPAQPQLRQEEWEAIQSYFLNRAPQAIRPGRHDPPIRTGLPGFEIREPEISLDFPLTTLTRIDEEAQRIFVGSHGRENTLFSRSYAGEIGLFVDLTGVPVDLQLKEDAVYVLTIGRGTEPNEAAHGAIWTVDKETTRVDRLISGLKRPVHMEFGDLTGNGLNDIVVSEFGHQVGYLSWFENMGNGNYERHVLKYAPGASKTVIHDFNGNGLPDIGALMAQGDEGFDIHFNNGDGTFDTQRVLRFPPVYGSMDFQLADFNGNGLKDILYVNGDNADLSLILKDYHGIRIFTNQGDGSYSEEYFYHVNGASAARAADFNGNGKLDLAVTSYFPDYVRTPEESFVLLKNVGDFEYEAYTFGDSYRGRWLRLDVGDLNGNGRPDILLGSNITFAPENDSRELLRRWRSEAVSYIILENLH